MTKSLLIVSADAKFAQVLLHGLEQEGYRVQITKGKGESVVRADEENSSLAFLDMDLGYRAVLETGQALLQVKRGPNAGSTFLLDTDSTSVGRNTDNVVFLDDITVSRRHATFERRPGGEWFVRDAGSLNGTYVNGEQVDETKLATGDQVQIGRFRLTFFQAGE